MREDCCMEQISTDSYDLHHDDDQRKRLEDMSRDPRFIEDPAPERE